LREKVVATMKIALLQNATVPKFQQMNRPKTVSPRRKSPQNQDMMLQNDHGPVPIATFAVTFDVTFPKDPKKEIDDPLALY